MAQAELTCKGCRADFAATFVTRRPLYCEACSPKRRRLECRDCGTGLGKDADPLSHRQICDACRKAKEASKSRRRTLSRNPTAGRRLKLTAEERAAALRSRRERENASRRRQHAECHAERLRVKAATKEAQRVDRQDQKLAARAEAIRLRPWLAASTAAERNKLRRQHDPEFALRERLRLHGRKRRQFRNLEHAVRKALGTNKMGAVYRTMLGYDAAQLKAHIESRFTVGMDWLRFLAGDIHIDHIVPVAAFDFDDAAQIRTAWALGNLQPLWASENIRKGARHGAKDFNPRRSSGRERDSRIDGGDGGLYPQTSS